MPALFAVMFLGMQAALIYHARTMAIASAQEGARAAGAENGTARRGISTARDYLTDTAGDALTVHRRHRLTAPPPPPPSPCAGVALSVLPGLARRRSPSPPSVTVEGSPDEPRQPRRPERGSAALEAAIGLPAFMLFVALIILAGRVAIATQAVDSAAAAGRPHRLHRPHRRRRQQPPPAPPPPSSLADQNLHCVRAPPSPWTPPASAHRSGTPPPSPPPCGAWSTSPTWPCPGSPAPGPSPRPRTSPVDTFRERR